MTPPSDIVVDVCTLHHLRADIYIVSVYIKNVNDAMKATQGQWAKIQ